MGVYNQPESGLHYALVIANLPIENQSKKERSGKKYSSEDHAALSPAVISLPIFCVNS